MARLTFGVPVHNGERFLPQALESLRAQSMDDIVIVVSDNGSSDATEEICRAAAAEDPRIRYERQPRNRGGIWNFQHVLDMADTELFSWMAADDVKLPRFAEATIQALDEAGPGTMFACPRTQIIDASGVVTEDLNDERLGLDAATPAARLTNLYRSEASHPLYGVIRMSALRRTRGMCSMLGNDMIMLTELLCLGRMTLAPEQLFWQRRHETQVSLLGVSASSWFAPGQRPSASFVELRTDAGLLAAVSHIGLPPGERVRCWGAVLVCFAMPRWRAVVRDFANAAGVPSSFGRPRANRQD